MRFGGVGRPAHPMRLRAMSCNIRENMRQFIFACGAGLTTPAGSDRDCRRNAMGETCGREFGGVGRPPEPMRSMQ